MSAAESRWQKFIWQWISTFTAARGSQHSDLEACLFRVL
jgi:hypothetical protein